MSEHKARAIDGERAVEALRHDGPVIKAMIEQMRPDLAGVSNKEGTDDADARAAGNGGDDE